MVRGERTWDRRPEGGIQTIANASGRMTSSSWSTLRWPRFVGLTPVQPACVYDHSTGRTFDVACRHRASCLLDVRVGPGTMPEGVPWISTAAMRLPAGQ